jgi:hypothetical protein
VVYEPQDVLQISPHVASGDSGKALRALRDRLAEAIDRDPHPRDLAPLSQRLMDVLAELEKLPAEQPKRTALDAVREQVADELANRRVRSTSAG